jgi:hypothetical protein
MFEDIDVLLGTGSLGTRSPCTAEAYAVIAAELLHSVHQKIPPLFSAAEEMQPAASMTAEHI